MGATTTTAVPAKGLYFDRVDAAMEHSRSYYLDGKQIMEIRALPDVERPGKWATVVRWLRRDKWLSHGWGPLDSEADAMAMIDAIGIGVEAREAATYLGHVPPEGGS